MADLKIISYNTQGLHGIQKRIDVFDYIKSKKCHIFHYVKDLMIYPSYRSDHAIVILELNLTKLSHGKSY